MMSRPSSEGSELYKDDAASLLHSDEKERKSELESSPPLETSEKMSGAATGISSTSAVACEDSNDSIHTRNSHLGETATTVIAKREGVGNVNPTVQMELEDSDEVKKQTRGTADPESEEDTNSRGDKPEDEERFVYRDFSRVAPSTIFTSTAGFSSGRSKMTVQKLPAKLNAMLSCKEFQHIISWMPHGRSWKVHKPHAFVEQVIPRFFEYTNYNSFIRLVNAWGFRRILKGADRNSYYHELFLRGMPHLHAKMHRLTASEKKAPVDPDDEPDFYQISELLPLPPDDADQPAGEASSPSESSFEERRRADYLDTLIQTSPGRDGRLKSTGSPVATEMAGTGDSLLESLITAKRSALEPRMGLDHLRAQRARFPPVVTSMQTLEGAPSNPILSTLPPTAASLAGALGLQQYLQSEANQLSLSGLSLPSQGSAVATQSALQELRQQLGLTRSSSLLQRQLLQRNAEGLGNVVSPVAGLPSVAVPTSPGSFFTGSSYHSRLDQPNPIIQARVASIAEARRSMEMELELIRERELQLQLASLDRPSSAPSIGRQEVARNRGSTSPLLDNAAVLHQALRERRGLLSSLPTGGTSGDNSVLAAQRLLLQQELNALRSAKGEDTESFNKATKR